MLSKQTQTPSSGGGMTRRKRNGAFHPHCQRKITIGASQIRFLNRTGFCQKMMIRPKSP